MSRENDETSEAEAEAALDPRAEPHPCGIPSVAEAAMDTEGKMRGQPHPDWARLASRVCFAYCTAKIRSSRSL